MKDKYVYIFEGTLTAVVALGLFIFDSILDLGQFRGFVFYIYFTYYLALISIINLLFGIVRLFQKNNYKKYFVCLIVAFVLLMILFLTASFIQ